MADERLNSDWVDDYIRGRLSEAEQTAFEEQLMDDPSLQDELEVALAVRSTLQGVDAQDEAATGAGAMPDNRKDGFAPTGRWAPYAMAASVVLAVVSVTLLWRESVRTDELRRQVAALEAPVTGVLSVPVDIMRSAGGRTPDVILVKPESGLVVFDIEVAPRFRSLQDLVLSLRSEDGSEVFSSKVTADRHGRVTIALRSDQLPVGLNELHMTHPGLEGHDARLIEVRDQ